MLSPAPRFTRADDLLLYAMSVTLSNFFVRPNIDEILADQRSIEIDHIYEDLRRMRDWERVADRPDHVAYQLGRKELRIHVTHGRKTESNFGIDLIYEMVGEKYVVIQYKRYGRTIDHGQMEKIRNHFCPPGQHLQCKLKAHRPRRKVRLGTYCTPYYKIVGEDISSGEYVPLCFLKARMNELQLKTASPELLDQTISGDAFEELFVKCLVGSGWSYRPEDIALSALDQLYVESPKYAYLAQEISIDRDE